MYELNRVLLQSVGPKGARYEDILLDFRDRNADPARGSILYLENGGGKSVLLKLLFSALLPGRKYVLGADANTKTLENFVLTGDTAHVVLEWRRVTAQGEALDDLLLTGKVYEWRARQHSSDSRNLREAWYTARPTEGGLTLDTLPTRAVRDGSTFKRQFSSFKEQLEETNRAHPEIELVWTDVQRQWLEHLDAVGLDPELFKYQRQMNVDEGDADEMFAFRTHDAFIDFLLKAVTDTEGPSQLATNVDAYAEKLRDRERLQLEGRFVEGALDRLRPLAVAAAARDGAARDLQMAQGDGLALHAQFVGASATAAAEREQSRARAEEQEALASSLETRSRVLQEQLRDLRRRAAQFRLDAAAAALGDAETERRQVQSELAAWRAAEPLAAHRAAAASVKVLDEQLSAAEREAAPLLEQRAVAARRYAEALLSLLDDARAASAEAALAATASGDAASVEERAAGAARTDAGRLRAEAASAQQQLDRIEAERERLIEARLLSRGQNVEDARVELDERQEEAERREQHASERLIAIDQRLRALTQETARAELEEERAKEHANRLDVEHQAFAERSQELATSDRLRELASVERIDVWRMADPLRQALVEASGRAERDIVLLELEAADDRHAKAALEGTGRLPAARDAQRAVEVLRAANIPTVTGWDYLAESVRPEDRADVLRRLPELVGGVIVTNPAYRDRAEAALASASINPTSVITLGDSAELAEASTGRARFVVEPNAALYDEIVGADELEARAARLAQVAERRRDLDERHRHDQELRHRLEQLLSDCPAGRLDELAAAAAEQRARAANAAQALESARIETDRLTQERPTREDSARHARAELQATATARPQLEAFRKRAAEEPELREDVRLRGEEATAAEEMAITHTRAAQEHRGAAQELTRSGDDHDRRADRLAEELRGIQGVGEDLARRKPEVPIEELRGAYGLATRALEQATTDSQLAAEHHHAHTVEADLRSKLEEYTGDELALAAQVLLEATDRAARREGERRAERRLESADERRAHRLAEHAQRKQELARETPRDDSGRGPRAQLTQDLIPRDLDHAVALQQRLDRERSKAQENQRAAAETARQARERATRADSRAQVVGSYAESVAAALTSSGFELESDALAATADAFSGSTEEAKELMREKLEALQSADKTLDRAEEELRVRAEKVTRFAADDEFEAMAGGNLRQSLTRDDVATLARRSGELIPHLEARAAEVAKELASIEQHRTALLQRLASLVQAGLATLRQAARASRLPGELGDWSGKPFLRIDFDDTDSEDVLLERLGDVLDSSVSYSGNRDGITMLLRGVRAAAEPKGFRVTVLKPDTVLRDERVPVTAMGEFSGGQRLTAAIALYCTLAAMRSASRGRQKPRAGVLFLDNPIGKASAEYLLDIQLKVAERVGVQLIYTTGVFDLNALSKFPCVVRLRNDLDMRAGMQRIRVAEDLRAALLNGHAGEDDRGYLDAARVVHARTDEPTPA